MILVTVFKDRERYESDLRKAFLQIRPSVKKQDDAWAEAKEIVSKVDFSQKVNVSTDFYQGKKPGEIKEDVYAVGFSIAQGRRFKAKLSLDI